MESLRPLNYGVIMRVAAGILTLLLPIAAMGYESSRATRGSQTPGQSAANRHNGYKNEKLEIVQNNYGGRQLILSDHSKWEIYPKDMERSGGWIGGEIQITKEDVHYRRDGSKYYRYKLYNNATDNSVWARPIDQNSD